MSIWRVLYNGIRGGWQTANTLQESSFGYGDGTGDELVTQHAALKLSTVWACINLRSETIGSLPFQMVDADRKPVLDHPLSYLLNASPNYDQTPIEFLSMAVAQTDMHGTSASIIDRNSRGDAIGFTPVNPKVVDFQYNDAGTVRTWKLNGMEYSDKDVLDFRGFSMEPGTGISRLDAGRKILGAQLAADKSALMAFKQGLKVGGFLVPQTRISEPDRELIDKEMTKASQPGYAGRWFLTPAGMKPIAGTEFAVKPVDVQLLQSRTFGNMEICQLFNVPPPLVGITDKASTWASSIENINLFFLLYSLSPTVVRIQQRLAKKALTQQDIGRGLRPKFSFQSLLRGSMAVRQAFYASGLQNGWLNPNEIRDFEEMGEIPGGDQYRVQMNLAPSTQPTNGDENGT